MLFDNRLSAIACQCAGPLTPLKETKVKFLKGIPAGGKVKVVCTSKGVPNGIYKIGLKITNAKTGCILNSGMISVGKKPSPQISSRAARMNACVPSTAGTTAAYFNLNALYAGDVLTWDVSEARGGLLDTVGSLLDPGTSDETEWAGIDAYLMSPVAAADAAPNATTARHLLEVSLGRTCVAFSESRFHPHPKVVQHAAVLPSL